MKKDKELDIAYFLSFCMEQYKNRHQMSGEGSRHLDLNNTAFCPIWKTTSRCSHTQGHRC